MATYTGQLSKAPAREALIDIQFEPLVTIEACNSLATHVGGRYEKSFPIWQALLGFKLSSNGEPETAAPSRTAIGVRLESVQPPHVLQCRQNGFTFSRLSPYGSWAELRAAAKAEWDEFLKVAPPFVVTRLAVRYINELKLPINLRDFKEFLTCPPEVPQDLPQGLSSFLQRVVIPDTKNDCESIVTQAIDEAVAPTADGFTVLLDIDVYRIARIESKNVEALWSGLDQLRDQKNHMFFSHITNAMLERLR